MDYVTVLGIIQTTLEEAGQGLFVFALLAGKPMKTLAIP